LQENKPVDNYCPKYSFPQIHVNSDKKFIQYILSAAYYFGESLVVSKSDSTSHQYKFICSVTDTCTFIIHFHKKGENTLVLNEKTSNFQHDHEKGGGKKRIKKYIYDEYLDHCFRSSNVSEFIARLDGKTNVDGKKIEDRYKNNKDYYFNYNEEKMPIEDETQTENEIHSEEINQKQLYNINYQIHKIINSSEYIMKRLGNDKYFLSKC